MISWRAPCRDTTRAARRDAAQEMGHTTLRKGGTPPLFETPPSPFVWNPTPGRCERLPHLPAWALRKGTGIPTGASKLLRICCECSRTTFHVM